MRHGCGPGKKVGVIGLGGLGHFAVMLAAQGMGADVTVFSHSDSKKDDAMKMGAKNFVMTSDEKWTEKAGEDFDIIISTRDVADGFPVGDFLSLLNVHGSFVLCGLPDKPLPEMMAQGFASNAAGLHGSHIGSKKEVQAMLQMCADKGKEMASPTECAVLIHKPIAGIKTWIQELPMSKAAEAVKGVKENKVKYRYVLKVDI